MIYVAIIYVLICGAQLAFNVWRDTKESKRREEMIMRHKAEFNVLQREQESQAASLNELSKLCMKLVERLDE